MSTIVAVGVCGVGVGNGVLYRGSSQGYIGIPKLEMGVSCKDVRRKWRHPLMKVQY